MSSFVLLIGFISLFILFLLLHFNSASIKGRIGEYRIARILNKLPDNYYLINDLYIQQNGYSTQIDHVVISEYGVFVIETKNYSGWIYGSDNAEYWTKNQYGHKYRFYNPIRQNEAHIRTLQNIFPLYYDKFVPIVVFLQKATLKFTTSSIVIYSSQLRCVIKSFKSQILQPSEAEDIFDKLLSANITDPELRKQHKWNVSNNINKKRTLVNNGICPRCGGRLVVRRGRYGNFIGCSNYPRCRYTS
ncbi:MAG: NERD domain-containing protein [Alloprevotella sp.]|nr:NERD domain-containing protein [Alloprevotella sp.]